MPILRVMKIEGILLEHLLRIGFVRIDAEFRMSKSMIQKTLKDCVLDTDS